MEYKGYTARVVFDADAGVLFGEVEGLRDVVTFEATNVEELQVAFRESVNDYLAMCAERGEEPERPYSGKFLLRVDPRLHREIAMAAASSGKSLNAFAAELLQTWIQGERQSAPVRRRPSQMPNAQRDREPTKYLTDTEASVLIDSRKVARIWEGETTRSTPGSITPAGQSDTPSASTSRQSKALSSQKAA